MEQDPNKQGTPSYWQPVKDLKEARNLYRAYATDNSIVTCNSGRVHNYRRHLCHATKR